MKKEAILSSSTFSVERERPGHQKQHSLGEQQRFETNAGVAEGSCRYDKADEIRKILEKIAMERLRNSEGWRKTGGDKEVDRGSTQGLDMCAGRKADREEEAGGRARHSSGKSLDQLSGKRSRAQDHFSTEDLLRELSRAADCSSSESSKSERGRRRIPMSRQQSSNKLVPGVQEYHTGYKQDVQVS